MTGRVRVAVLDSQNIPFLEIGDPEIDSFFKRAWEEKQNCNNVTYILYLDEIPTGYASVSMKSLHVELPQGSKSYPALLLARLGVDKRFRGKHIFEGMRGGVYLLKYIVGLAQKVGERVGCRLVILDTDPGKLEQYYRNFGFETSGSKRKKISMYYDICETIYDTNNFYQLS